jgi:superfamily II DNA or RNA helicase/HKD family nuclease/ribosomal protein S17E
MNDKFITNTDGNTLKKRLVKYLPATKGLDALVGYFYAQGFHVIKDEFSNVEKIRILVGMATEDSIVKSVSDGQVQLLDELSDNQLKDVAVSQIVDRTDESRQTIKEFESLDAIGEYVKTGKLEVRAYRKQQLHAKLYVLHTPESGIINGAAITGSSNLTRNGLENNLEINVVLTDDNDYTRAKDIFDDLWKDSVDISELLVEKIKNDTWLEPVDPAAIFYRAAFEYIGGSRAILEPDDDEVGSSQTKFKKLKYQDDAARQAVDIIRKYNGVFLADVVGLGKTIMGSLVLRRMRNIGLRSTALVICAPGLIKEWQDWTSDIGGGSVRVYSSGDLPKILHDIRDGRLKENNVDTILIDESHNFKNAASDTYGVLQEITNKKKVALLSATPQTKSTWDIGNQLNLFADATDFMDVMEGKSIKVFFDEVDKLPTTQEKAVKLDSLMRAIMIRRTRSEIIDFYQDDITSQGLTFPSAADPEVILYELDTEREGLLSEVERLIGQLKLPRFQPKAFIQDEYLGDKTLEDLSKGGDQLKAINRILLFKRLESSVVAILKTLNRQRMVNRRFIEIADENGLLPFGIENIKMLKADIDWLIDSSDNNIDDIASDLNQNYKKAKFKYDELKCDIEDDNETLSELIELLSPITPDKDRKLQHLISQLSSTLVGQKVLVFSESKETAEYLHRELTKHLDEEVGLAHGQIKTSEYEALKNRFSPNSNSGLPSNKSELRVLVATDTFSEGVNLQDANHVINYDIPWNPIRIIQRVGRVNRVGSAHKIAYSYNYFPSDELDEHIGSSKEFAETLKMRVKRRIEEFQAIIGDDTKHLSPDEQPEPRKFFKIVTESTDNLDGEQAKYSFSELLALLRKLRLNDPEYYDYVTNEVPKRAWTSRKNTIRAQDEIITVAKRKKHIVFYRVAADKVPVVLNPTQAFVKLDANRDEKNVLNRPTEAFSDSLQACENIFLATSRSDIINRRITSTSYEGKLQGLIKEYYLPTLNSTTREILNQYRSALTKELIRNRRAIKETYAAAKVVQNASELAEVLTSHLPLSEYGTERTESNTAIKPEILLSCIFKN